jgi:hypothetical protein
VREFDKQSHRKESESVNPQFHEEFVALNATFFSGELTDEEWALLQVHLAHCDDCRRAFDEYKKIHSAVIPAMAAGAAAESGDAPIESDNALREAERRLMSRLEAPPDSYEPQIARKTSWRSVGGVIAASVVAAAALICVPRLVRRSSPPPVLQASNAAPTSSPASEAPAKRDTDLQTELELTKQKLAEVRVQLAAAGNRSTQSNAAETSLQHQLQDEQTQYQQLTAERDSLSHQLATTQSNLQSLRDQVVSAEATATQQRARANSLEGRVYQLNVALEEKNTALDDKERMLALDKDFLSHDRDIRDLIGARNLYIADINDTNENGKTAKPFGRIFYTKDRYLAFYGFDLEKQAGLKEPVAFQAWGSGSDTKPVSLGLFYQDDSRKRWVVRFNDAKTLARLNMVFVTVEPPGGSSKPTGKQLLRAYLQIDPNHP